MNILAILLITFLTFGIVLALIYVLPIVFVPRLQKTNNIYTVSLCLAIVSCFSYWLALLVMIYDYGFVFSDVRNCILMNYLQMLTAMEIPFALIGISANRLCIIVYPRKAIFTKKKSVIIWISIQWIVGILLSLPRISVNTESCASQQWRGIYALFMIVVIPSLSYGLINLIIFRYVRLSTARVHPTNTRVSIRQDQPITRRDLHLLRHLIVMFGIFIGGWFPIFMYVAIVYNLDLGSTEVSLLLLLALFSVFGIMIDLFLYNHDLRKYFREKIFPRQ